MHIQFNTQYKLESIEVSSKADFFSKMLGTLSRPVSFLMSRSEVCVECMFMEHYWPHTSWYDLMKGGYFPAEIMEVLTAANLTRNLIVCDENGTVLTPPKTITGAELLVKFHQLVLFSDRNCLLPFVPNFYLIKHLKILLASMIVVLHRFLTCVFYHYIHEDWKSKC